MVNAIRGPRADKFDETIIRKVLRTLFAINVVSVFVIQQLRFTLGNDLTLDSLIGRLTTFELSNFDNYTPSSGECAFKSQLTLDGFKRKKKSKDVDSDSESYELEALLARRLPRVEGKYKGKLTIIIFTCNKVGHVVSRYPERDEKEESKDTKY